MRALGFYKISRFFLISHKSSLRELLHLEFFLVFPEPFHLLKMSRHASTYILNHLSSRVELGLVLYIGVVLVRPEKVSLPLQLLNFFLHFTFELFFHRLSRRIFKLLLEYRYGLDTLFRFFELLVDLSYEISNLFRHYTVT